jgi:transposase
MIHLTASTPILLAREPADFRAGIDGLVARCQQHCWQH